MVTINFPYGNCVVRDFFVVNKIVMYSEVVNKNYTVLHCTSLTSLANMCYNHCYWAKYFNNLRGIGMKKRKSKILLVLGAALCACAFAGCSKSHNSIDVKSYVKDMNIGKCKISSSRENEYGEKIWTVTQVSTGIEFEIIDDRSVGGMLGGSSYSLNDDFSSKMVEYYEDKLSAYDEISLVDGAIVLEYSSLDELKTGCEDLLDLYDFYFEQYEGFGLGTDFLYRGEFADKIEYHVTSQLDSMAHRTKLVNTVAASDIKKGFDQLYGQVKDRYLFMCIGHGLDSVHSEFTDEEIDEFVNSDTYGIERMVTYSEDGKGVVSPELVSMYGYIYYGGLYQYLEEQGIEVSGTALDFTVVGQDGKTYEFSYDFYDEKKDKTYYTVDGEKVYNQNRFCMNHHEVEQIFNLKLELMDNDDL